VVATHVDDREVEIVRLDGVACAVRRGPDEG
jgi:hypothetical protein